MKDKKSLKIKIAVIAAVVIYITVSVVLSVVLWKKNGGLTPGVKIYGLSENYSAEALAVKDYGDGAPVSITNGINNTVYNTAPELDIGYITEVFEGESSAEYYSPSFVVGEGENDDNGTIVRVYNEKQVCTAQFSAFPSSVKGGVKVAAGETDIDGKKVTLIATAAYGVYCDDARSVRVYDSHGMLYMKIIPEFWEKAPFAIATGHFVAGDDNEYLLIASSVVENGKIDAALYSLSDGAVVGEYEYNYGKEYNEKTVSFSVRNRADGNDRVIALLKDAEAYSYGYLSKKQLEAAGRPEPNEMYAVFEGVPSGTLEKADMDFPYGVTGVYSSANYGEKYIVTAENELNDDYISYVYTYGYGEREGKLLYVDYEDNRFYWNMDESYIENVDVESDAESYVQFADEITVNASQGPIEFIKNAEKNAKYAYWRVKLSEYGTDVVQPIYEAIAEKYRENPASFVAIELFSASDILTDISLNDSGETVRKGFADYLLNLYGSVKNINEKFGTVFEKKEDINIPADAEYSLNEAEQEYYSEWYKYTRYRVGKRITALYANAVNSGLPSELLTCDIDLADYLPGEKTAEDYNIVNKDYINEESIVPESMVYSLGASLGISRNGVWYTNPRHANSLAFSAGFKNITLSSYSSNTSSYETSFYQMLYLFRNGCKYVGLDSPDRGNAIAELNALDILEKRDTARTGYTHGTAGSVAVEYKGKKYNLITIGYNTNGLMKSINADGTREGSVYSVPFHTKVVSKGADVHNSPRRGLNIAEFKDMAAGSQIEVRFTASSKESDNSFVNIRVYHEGYLIEDACVSYRLSDTDKYYRYVFKNNLELGDVKIELEYACEDYTDFNLSDVDMMLQSENTIYPAADDFSGNSAYGSITVDVLDRDALYKE